MKCANCGTESDGNFCPSCGAALGNDQCAGCGANLVPGARFCTRCGAAAGGATGARGAASGGMSNLPWYIAGGVLLLLILILVVPMIDGGSDPAPLATGSDAAQTTASGAPPPLTGTPREQADRLFNRIMSARSRGDAAEALRFTPMAISAYAMAAPLDSDGLFHLATVHLVAGDTAAARSTAGQILAADGNHLLGLGVAGEAAEIAGDTAAARDYYSRLLAAYDAEVARGLPEYLDHSQILPEFRATAQRVVEK